jgi:DNA (cytosine-5)-methyltransferase 1
MIRILDICSGIGGFSLGLESTGGFDTVAFCEFDDFCRKVLNKHWPDVPIYKDLKEIGNEPERIIQDFDLICGGIPCQPFSVAGKKKGKEDDRHLWPYMYEIIKHKKPTWVIVENVGGFVNVALDDVCLDLETQGYATQSFIIPACSVEAPHKKRQNLDPRKRREDARILENPGRALRQGRIEQGENADEVGQGHADQLERSSSTSRSDVANATSEGLEGRISGDNQGGQEWQALSRSEEQQHQVGADTRCSSEVSTKEDVPNASGQRLQGHRGEHGLREASQEEQTSRSSQERDVSHAKELDRDVDDNGHSGQCDGQQRQGLQGELGGASGNRAEDVADTERLGQQGQGEHERPSNTAKASEGQASGTDDGSQGQTGQGHTEPGVGGMADGVSARLDGHYGFEREPNIPRVATGIPERVNRLKALGNSIVPQVIYNIGLAILEEEKRTNVAK